VVTKWDAVPIFGMAIPAPVDVEWAVEVCLLTMVITDAVAVSCTGTMAGKMAVTLVVILGVVLPAADWGAAAATLTRLLAGWPTEDVAAVPRVDWVGTDAGYIRSPPVEDIIFDVRAGYVARIVPSQSVAIATVRPKVRTERCFRRFRPGNQLWSLIRSIQRLLSRMPRKQPSDPFFSTTCGKHRAVSRTDLGPINIPKSEPLSRGFDWGVRFAT
jgi:hypothetical protein